MLAGSTHGLPGTLVCTTWEWQSMHGVPSWCCSWENVTGGGDEPPAGEDLAVAAGEAVAADVAPTDVSVSGSGTLPAGWQSLAVQVESGMCRVTAIGALTSPVKCTQTSRSAEPLAFTNCTAPGLMWQCTQAMSLCFDFSHVRAVGLHLVAGVLAEAAAFGVGGRGQGGAGEDRDDHGEHDADAEGAPPATPARRPAGLAPAAPGGTGSELMRGTYAAPCEFPPGRRRRPRAPRPDGSDRSPGRRARQAPAATRSISAISSALRSAGSSEAVIELRASWARSAWLRPSACWTAT